MGRKQAWKRVVEDVGRGLNVMNHLHKRGSTPRHLLFIPFPAFFPSFDIFLLFLFLSLTPCHALPSTPETLWKRVPTQQFPDPFFSLLSPPSLSLRRKLSTFPPGCLFLGLPETVGQYPMDSLRLSSFSSMLDLSAPLSQSDLWMFHKFLFPFSP